MTPALYLAGMLALPETFMMEEFEKPRKRWYCFVASTMGVWGGLLIGYITEYYTSYAYNPTIDVAKSC